jgi:2-polyprenyl-6-methoxyphenol hydroxylase-like FAD-dependent oxidoreductase
VSPLGGRAVVLGAGMAGLLTAAVLSDFYDNVTVVERDVLPTKPLHRRGVPQGRHLHSLLSRGSQVLEELLPGLLAELVAAGVNVVDDGDLSRIYTRLGPHEVNRSGKFADPAALVQYLPSRPLLEFHLRQRVSALPNTEFLDGHDLVEMTAPSPDRITGVRVASRDSEAMSTLVADLVVDAMGRAARTPAVLASLGYDRPSERISTATASYYSQLLQVAPGAIPEKLALVIGESGSPSGGLVAAENGTYILTVTRLGRSDQPPTDLAALLAIAQRLLPPSALPGLRSAQPLGGVVAFRYPGGTWRRYDHMTRFPHGLLVIGDALCTLNPQRGQGITVAALEVLALRDTLRQGHDDIAHPFFTAAARHIAPVWALNESQEPNANTSQRQTRSISSRISNWFTNSALTAAKHDIVLTERMFRVANLIDSPGHLRDPALAARIILGSFKRRVPASPHSSGAKNKAHGT